MSLERIKPELQGPRNRTLPSLDPRVGLIASPVFIRVFGNFGVGTLSAETTSPKSWPAPGPRRCGNALPGTRQAYRVPWAACRPLLSPGASACGCRASHSESTFEWTPTLHSEPQGPTSGPWHPQLRAARAEPVPAPVSNWPCPGPLVLIPSGPLVAVGSALPSPISRGRRKGVSPLPFRFHSSRRT